MPDDASQTRAEPRRVEIVVSGATVFKAALVALGVGLFGGALMGVIGAILAVPVAGSLKVIFREVTAARRDQMEALRAQEATGSW